MKFALVLSCFVPVVLISACASNSNDRLARSYEFEVVDDAGRVTHLCRTERPTGSNIGRRNCRSVEQIQAERDEAQSEVGRVLQAPLRGPIDNL